MNVNPLSLRDVQKMNLRLLEFLAADSEPDTFWLLLLKACRDEEQERGKPEAERREIVFEVPSLPPVEASVVRNELTLLVNRMERGSSDDDAIMFLCAVGLALGEQVSAAAAMN